MGVIIMVRYPNAASGIKKVFLAKVIAIVGVVLAFIPLLGIFLGLGCSIAACILNIMGIMEASKDDEGYHSALVFTVASVIVSAIKVFVSSGSAFAKVLSYADDIFQILVLFYVCTTTARLLGNAGNMALSAKGDRVWNINKTCLIIIVVCAVLAFIPLVNILAALTSIIVALVMLYASIVYLVFLYQSGEYLSLNTNF